MEPQNEFVSYLMELLGPLGGVQAKAMFGGFGIYRKGLMFALVSDDTLYFNVDEESRTDFEGRGLGPFTYTRKGKELALSYYEAPPEVLDHSEEICRWAQRAYEIAVRAANGQRKGKKKGKGP